MVVVKIVSLVSPVHDSGNEDDLDDTLDQAMGNEDGTPQEELDVVVGALTGNEVLGDIVPLDEEWSEDGDGDKISEDGPHETTIKHGYHKPAHADGEEHHLNGMEPSGVQGDELVVVEEPVGWDDSIAHDQGSQSVPAHGSGVVISSDLTGDTVLDVAASVTTINLCVTHINYFFF